MKLFTLVPAINETHTALGFLPSQIRRIASRVEKVFIFTLSYDREIPLPDNVEVHCLPNKGSRVGKLVYLNWAFLKNIIKADVVFCFMYPIFTIWVAPYAKIFRKPVIMWYAHGTVSRKMKIAHFLATKAVTSSKDGFRIRSKKIQIVGQAIDTDKFKPKNRKAEGKKKILYLGRISSVKGIEDLIKAADILINSHGIKDIGFSIVGDIPGKSYKAYYEGLRKLAESFGLERYFTFVGTVPYSKIEAFYQECDLFVNPSHTGSLDKTVLEAMACGKTVITSNEAYYNIFDEDIRKRCYFCPGNYEELAEKIRINLLYPDDNLGTGLREIVVKDHSVDLWVEKLLGVFHEAGEITIKRR